MAETISSNFASMTSDVGRTCISFAAHGKRNDPKTASTSGKSAALVSLNVASKPHFAINNCTNVAQIRADKINGRQTSHAHPVVQLSAFDDPGSNTVPQSGTPPESPSPSVARISAAPIAAASNAPDQMCLPPSEE
jgi:hypothetical protein